MLQVTQFSLLALEMGGRDENRIESTIYLPCRGSRLTVHMGSGLSPSNAWNFYIKEWTWQLNILADLLLQALRMPLFA
jgi:hypothetical protein